MERRTTEPRFKVTGTATQHETMVFWNSYYFAHNFPFSKFRWKCTRNPRHRMRTSGTSPKRNAARQHLATKRQEPLRKTRRYLLGMRITLRTIYPFLSPDRRAHGTRRTGSDHPVRPRYGPPHHRTSHRGTRNRHAKRDDDLLGLRLLCARFILSRVQTEVYTEPKFPNMIIRRISDPICYMTTPNGASPRTAAQNRIKSLGKNYHFAHRSSFSEFRQEHIRKP